MADVRATRLRVLNTERSSCIVHVSISFVFVYDSDRAILTVNTSVASVVVSRLGSVGTQRTSAMS